MRLAWALLGSSALAWAAGEAARSYIDVIQDLPAPFSSVVAGGYLAAVPLAALGTAFFPGRHRAGSRIAFLLDGAIMAGALLLISWATFGSVYAAASDLSVSSLIALAHPIGDIVIAVVALLLVGRAAGSMRLPLLLVVVGVFANLLSDSAVTYLTTIDPNGLIQTIGVGWVAGYLLIALGAVRAGLVARSGSAVDERAPGHWTLVLPYIPLAIAAVLAVLTSVNGPRQPILLWDLLVV